MKKILLLMSILLIPLCVFAVDEDYIVKENSVQNRIDRVGSKILNANKLEKRVVFVYDQTSKKELLKGSKNLTKRQVMVYKDAYKYVSNDDELAGYLSREIAAAIRSYDGIGDGWLSSLKIKAAPKKYELVFDKIAVDYMVKAGYSPIGLITYINKSCPQTRQDKISNKNLTSKRLAYIYERICMNYPSYIVNNKYADENSYQNFLLTSQNNRRKLEQKIKSGNYRQEIKYE